MTATDRYGQRHTVLTVRRYGPMLSLICGSEDDAYVLEVHHTKISLRRGR